MPEPTDTGAGTGVKGPFIPHSAYVTNFKLHVPDNILNEASLVEIYLGESILNPVLTTTISVQDTASVYKNLDAYKGAYVDLSMYNPNIGEDYTLDVKQVIYRIENRMPMNYNSESFNLQACDETLLNNARVRISYFWQCSNPGSIVDQVLNCAGAKNIIMPKPPSNIRNYQAANIHPFQIIAEQADFSINSNNDPSYLHFMTYRKFGSHHFESFQDMTKKAPVWYYYYNEKGQDTQQIGDPHSIMQYSFPCEFDLLSDIMNGLDFNPEYKTSMISVNPQSGEMYLVGGQVGDYGCGGIGGVISASAFSNMNSSQDDGCETAIEQYLHLRPPRMALLQSDKISLKMIVPFNPIIHAGDMIDVKFYAKRDDIEYDYGSGKYLIVSLTHNIKPGATMYATTTLECVSRSVGTGEV